jgi:Tol biopolymer transport system component
MKPGYFHKSTHPQWSPDGRWIAFMSFGGIFRVHPDGTEPQLIIRDGYFPTWSPDGSMLMYVIKTGNPIAITGPSDHIFVAHADGSDPTEIPLDDKCLSRCSYEDLNWAE